MSFSQEYANRILNQTFSGSSYKVNSTYVALFTSVPTFSGSGTEVSGAAYARVGVHPGTGWTAVASGLTSNVASVTFAAATSRASLNVYGWGIFDSNAGGVRVCQSSLASPLVINSGDTVSFPPGSLTVTVAGSCSFDTISWGLEYMDAVMKATFNNSAAIGVSSIWLALYVSTPSFSSSGTELSGGGYDRWPMPPGNWTAASGALVATNTAAQFAQLTASLGVITGYGIFVAAAGFPTSGQTIRAFQGSLGVPVTIASGETVSFTKSDLLVTLVESC